MRCPSFLVEVVKTCSITQFLTCLNSWCFSSFIATTIFYFFLHCFKKANNPKFVKTFEAKCSVSRNPSTPHAIMLVASLVFTAMLTGLLIEVSLWCVLSLWPVSTARSRNVLLEHKNVLCDDAALKRGSPILLRLAGISLGLVTGSGTLDAKVSLPVFVSRLKMKMR